MAIGPKNFVQKKLMANPKKAFDISNFEQAMRAMQDHLAKEMGVTHPVGGSFNELEALVKTLEARVKELERALSEADKSEWDKFEELSSGI